MHVKLANMLVNALLRDTRMYQDSKPACENREDTVEKVLMRFIVLVFCFSYHDS